MRYAALVDYAETADFGRYHMLAPGTKRVSARMPDEALYALALYIYSLKPPPNPNPLDEKARSGPGDLCARGMPNVPYAAALYEQQAHSGKRLHAAETHRLPLTFCCSPLERTLGWR